MSEGVRQLFMRRPDLENLPEPPLPPGYELRLARSEDDAALAEVMISAFGPDWSVERVRRELLDAEDVKATYVVAHGDVPVATTSARLVPDLYPDSGYIHWVGGHADHRGKDLGYIVTAAALRWFRDHGCRDSVLETDPPRIPAIRVYLRLDFEPVNVAPEHEAIWRDILAQIGDPAKR